MAEISMIVPVYQVEKYIGQCIESVLSQSFQDFELILVDDGSKDHSGKICDAYAEQDDRIIVLHTGNHGAAAARNAGLERASGRFITFLDGDDYITQNMLQRLHEVICDSEYDVVACGFFNLHLNETDDFVVTFPEQTVQGRMVLEHLKNGKNFGFWTIVWNKIYKRELLEHLRFPTGKYFEDEFFSDQLFFSADQVHIIEDVLCQHRVLAESTMNTQKAENYLDLLDALQERIALYIQHKYSPDETFKVLIYLLEPFVRCTNAKFTGTNRARLQESKKFIRQTAGTLMGMKLSWIKKIALLMIRLSPEWTYRMAIRFRGILENLL